MAIAPLQPHKSWYQTFWYAERSPRDRLIDRALIFGIVTLSLIAGGMAWLPHNAVPPATHQDPLAQALR